DRVDYERWVGEWGCVGWGPDDLAPWLERTRADQPTVQIAPGPVSAALAEAAANDGLPVGGSSLDPGRLGVLSAVLSADDGRRWSAADAHFDGDGDGDGDGHDGGGQPDRALAVRQLLERRLSVVTGCAVRRVEADAVPGGHRVHLGTGATVEAPLVVLAAGALGSPALLLASGLTGRPVGRTLVDHPSFSFTLVLRPEVGRRPERSEDPAVVTTMVRWSSGPEWPGDLQAIAIDRVANPGAAEQHLAVLAVGLMAVTSRGSVHRADDVAPSAPGAGRSGWPPRLDVVTGALDRAEDRRRLRHGVRQVGRWLRSGPFDGLVSEVHLDDAGRPLADLDRLSDDELDRVLAARPGPYAHPAGTCPLGRADGADAVTAIEPGRRGEIIDRPGIRVADSSVFPDLVRGGLQLPVGAVAARIAEDIVAGS
ncbi:MAG: GMC oxidoreductase, partial [Actinomycetota bacterium]